MKKVSIAILAIIYLGVSSGVAINIHYCMGKPASVDLMHTSEKCGKCGMKKSNTNGCCKDEFKMVKLDDLHKLFNNDIKINSPVSTIDNLNVFSEPNAKLTPLNPVFNNHSPPSFSASSLRVLYCTFRI